MKIGKTKTLASIAALCLLVAGTLPVQAKPASLTELKIYPPDVELTTSADRQSIVVQAIYADGITRDVTTQATYTFASKGLARMDNFVLYPMADGQTDLKVKFEGKTLIVPIKVQKAKQERPISFKLDVVPVFSKAGCNSGACHGASRGKDGFRISLFGYDPDGDYYRLTRELVGRRVNLALPESSLVLEKGA